jgi:mTERF domain-containing protein, mitochondrial
VLKGRSASYGVLYTTNRENIISQAESWSEFPYRDVGLKPHYIVHRPQILVFSLQKRLMPRHYAMKVLKDKGLVKEFGFYIALSLFEKKFVERFLVPFNKSVPGLADAYATVFAGKMPR